MSKIYFENFIVGTGPAGWAATLACIDSNFKPTVIDADDIFSKLFDDIKHLYKEQFSKSTENFKLQGVRYSKKYFNSNKPFTTNNSKVYEIPKNYSFYSKSSGGFSLIWGNAIQIFRQKDMALRFWGEDEYLNSNDYLEILKNMENISLNLDFIDIPLNKNNLKLNFFSDSDFLISRWRNFQRIGSSSLALNFKNCIKCGLCMDGCLYDCLFETRSKFIELINKNLIEYLPNIVLEKFEITSDGLVLLKVNKGGNKVDFLVKNLFLAAGALSSSLLFLASSNESLLKLRDSQAITFPIIRTKKSKQFAEYKVELSDIFVQDFDRFGKMKTHAQFYPVSRTTKSFYNKFFPLKFISNYLSVGHLFLDYEDSGEIFIKRVNNHNNISSAIFTKRSIKTFLIGIIKIFKLMKISLKKGVIIIPLPIFSRVGESYHFGTLEHLVGTNFYHINQTVAKKFPNVLFLDASSSPLMPPGPITLSIMAQSYKKVFLHLNKK